MIRWEGIDAMLEEETRRWGDPCYNGLIVVHPDLKYPLLKRIQRNFRHDIKEINLSRSRIILKYGSELFVDCFKGESCINNHGGAQYTTVMVAKGDELMGCQNGTNPLLPVVQDTDFSWSVNYIKTRIRSESECPSKFIQM